MRYYDENTQRILTTKGVRKAVYPSCLPKNFTLGNIISFGIKGYAETQKPEPSTNLKKIIAGDPVQTEDGNWAQVWAEVDKFSDIPDSLTKAEQETAYLAELIISSRIRIQNQNKANCKSLIYTRYNQEFQNNMGIGLIPEATAATAATWIMDMREEENRVFDLLEAATTLEELNAIETPTWEV